MTSKLTVIRGHRAYKSKSFIYVFFSFHPSNRPNKQIKPHRWRYPLITCGNLDQYTKCKSTISFFSSETNLMNLGTSLIRPWLIASISQKIRLARPKTCLMMYTLSRKVISFYQYFWKYPDNNNKKDTYSWSRLQCQKWIVIYYIKKFVKEFQ